MKRVALALLALTPCILLEASAIGLSDLAFQAAPAQSPAASGAPTDSASAAQAPPAAPVNPSIYMIGPQDVLDIRVWDQPQLTSTLTVRADGKISMQFIGDVQVANVTPVQLAKDIEAQLLKLIKDPHVNVAVQAQRSRRYYIQGNVRAPGEHYLIGPTTVLQALVGAAFEDFAPHARSAVALRKQRPRSGSEWRPGLRTL